MRKNTFRKEERLCSKRSIDDLFHNGSSFVLYPYRVVFARKQEQGAHGHIPVSVLFSVPKRRFRQAVDRNLIKRRMREAYRQQKVALLIPFFLSNTIHISVAIQYIAKDIESFDVFYKRMADLFIKLQHECTAVYLGEDH